MKLNTKTIKADAWLATLMAAWGLIPVGLAALGGTIAAILSVVGALAILAIPSALKGHYVTTDTESAK